MSRENIYTGSVANDGTGDTLRAAFTKTNNNFIELYATVANTSCAAAIGIGANSYADLVGVGANARTDFVAEGLGNYVNIISSDTGAGANSYAESLVNSIITISGSTFEEIGAAANAYSDGVGSAANAYSDSASAGANAYSDLIVAGAYEWSNSIANYIGSGSNSYTDSVASNAGAGANAYSDSIVAGAYSWANSIGNYSGSGSNAYTNQVVTEATQASNTIAIAAFDQANSRLSVYGGLIDGDLSITGNLFVVGNVTYTNTDSLAVDDPLIYLAENNRLSDDLQIGFIASYNNGACTNVHTGLVRDHLTKEYYLFYGYDQEPFNNDVDISGNNFTIATLNAAIRSSNITLGGVNAIVWITSAYDQANSVGLSANAYVDSVANVAGAAANTYADSVGINAGSGANAYATLIGTSSNAYATAAAAGANAYANAVTAGSNAYATLIGTSSNAYATAAAAGANNWSNTQTQIVFTQANAALNAAYSSAGVMNANTASYTTGTPFQWSVPTSKVDITLNTVKLANNQSLMNGDPVTYNSNGGAVISPLTNGGTYYVRVLDPNTVYLYNTPSNAIAYPSTTGIMDLTTTGTNAQYFTTYIGVSSNLTINGNTTQVFVSNTVPISNLALDINTNLAAGQAKRYKFITQGGSGNWYLNASKINSSTVNGTNVLISASITNVINLTVVRLGNTYTIYNG